MTSLIKLSVAGALSLVMLSQPALADRDRDHGRHRGHDKHWNKHHHKHWDKHNRTHVTIYTAPRYVQPVQRVYYTQPAYHDYQYSEIRCTNSYNPLGMILGGAAGGVVGNTIGKGKGNTAATIAGAVIGAGIGGNHIGSQHCSEQVFQQAPIGMPISWQDARAGNYYAVTPTREYRTAGRYCREYQTTARVGGGLRETYGTACMQPDGSWEIVN